MKNLQQYFEIKKTEIHPTPTDFEMVLAKLDTKPRTGEVPSPFTFTMFMRHRFVTVATTGVFALLLVTFINMDTAPAPLQSSTQTTQTASLMMVNDEPKIAMSAPTVKRESIDEALSVIDSVSSFDTSHNKTAQ